jgi:hypothetical protein
MRCPNCAGEVPAGSRFCGICGRNVTVAPEPLAQVVGSASGGGQWPAAARREAQAAMSLFELPVSRGARTAKLALVLVLDAILAGAGIVMILSYLDARRAEPEPARKPAPDRSGAVTVGAPKAVAPAAAAAAPTEAQPGKKTQKKQETGDRQPATGNRQPKAAPIGGAAPTRGAEAPAPEAAAAPVPEIEPSDDGPDPVADVSGQMRQLVARHAADLERCYQRAAKVYGPQDPLEGRIDVHVTVMPDGSARDVRAGENTTGSAELAGCTVSLFRTFGLPSGAAAPVELVWPLQFRPTDQ